MDANALHSLFLAVMYGVCLGLRIARDREDEALADSFRRIGAEMETAYARGDEILLERHEVMLDDWLGRNL